MPEPASEEGVWPVAGCGLRLAGRVTGFARHLRRPWHFFAVVLAFSTTWFICSIPYFRSYNDPPEPYDGPDYDMIGWCLANGYGFGQFWSSAEYQRPYRESVHVKEYEYLTSRTGPCRPTTSRPPFLPFVLAGIYKVFGRRFWVWRVCSSAFAGAALAVSATLAYRFMGLTIALLTLAWGLVDPRMLNFAAGYMTEAPAMLGVVLLFLFLTRLTRHRRWRDAAGGGVVLGLLVLVRSSFVLWYPLVLLMLWRPLREAKTIKHGQCSRQRLLTVLLAAAVLVPSPWWVRNCLVLHAFMPLGTQGHMVLPAGYSWYAVLHRGQWTREAEDEIRQSLLKHRPDVYGKGIETERELARTSFAVALWWAVSHPHRLPQLAWYKTRRLWTPLSAHQWCLMIAALCGALVALNRPWAWPAFGLFMTQTLVVAATHNELGRFLVPLQPLLHLFAGLGVWALLRRGRMHVRRMRRLADRQFPGHPK